MDYTEREPVSPEKPARHVHEAAMERPAPKLPEEGEAGLFGVFEWDILSGVVVWDSASITMFGISDDGQGFSYSAWADRVVPEDLARIEALFKEWMASNRKEEHWKFRFLRPDGEVRWIGARGILFRDEEGRPVRVIGSNHDITRFKQAEQAMLCQKEDFETIFNLLPAQIWYKDAHNHILRVNDKVCRDIGLPREKIEGYSTEEIFPLFAEEYFRADSEVIATGRPKLGIEERINTASGDILWIRTDKVPVKDAQGNVVGVLAIVADLTEQKRTEESLRREADRSQALLELYDKARLLSDTELYAFALDHAVQLTGSEIGFFHLVSDDQQTIELKAWNREALKHCQVQTETHYPLEKAGNWADCVRLRRPVVYNDYAQSPNQKGMPEGHPAVHRYMSVPVVDGDKVKIIFGVGNKARDYDEKDVIHIQLVANELQKVIHERRAEEALKQAKDSAEAANKAKDQFLAVLSHELRTPLTPVLATVSDLQAQESLGEELREDMDLVRRNVEMESKLIDDLLDVTRISRGTINLHLEVVDVCMVLRTALEICQKEIDAKRLDVSLNFLASAHHVRADPVRLRQVFWNLIKNAVEFTPEGGRISLRTTDARGRLQVEVSDTGIGIRPELLPKIFNAFERGDQTASRRFGGLGLGLNIAKSVVEMHHGTLVAFSEGTDKGATFVVELPCVLPGEGPVAPPVREPAQEPLRKILLVDDHPDTLMTLAKLLRRWGYAVVTADGVRAALRLAAKEPFDLLVSDLGLGDGSGLDIMREMKHRYGVRGIAFSGYGTEEDLRRSREAGFEEHITKPVNADILRAAVQRIAAGGLRSELQWAG